MCEVMALWWRQGEQVVLKDRKLHAEEVLKWTGHRLAYWLQYPSANFGFDN